MPHYHSLGKIPPKRHTQFKKTDGSLYSEQHLGTIGFSGMYSNAYHVDPPTAVKKILNQYSIAPEIAKPNNIQSYKLAIVSCLHVSVGWPIFNMERNTNNAFCTPSHPTGRNR